MANQAISIDKLNAHNYPSWSADMKFVLMERNAWDIVDEKESEPELNEKQDNISEISDYKRRKRIALSIIYLFIESEFRKIVEKCDDPVDSWKKLREHFYPDNRSQHMCLFSELLSCRIQENEQVDLYAARLRRLYDRLTSIDKDFSEKYLCFQLLRYLPPEFDSIVQSTLRLPDKDFIFDKIVLDLISEETRLTLKEKDQCYPYSTSQITKRDPQSRGARVCYQCGKSGHISRNCKDSKSRRRSTSRNRYPSPERTSRQNTDYQEPSFPRRYGRNRRHPNPCKSINFFLTEANIGETSSDGDEWVFDTAASHHFCNNRKLFTNFTPLRHEKMAVAVQGVSFPIEGKGKVKLKFGPRTIYLNEVMFSPKLRRNLISGPRFDMHNAEYYGGKGVVNMSDSEGELIFKATLKNGVYQVKPKIPSQITKHVKFETSATDIDEMCRWHKRLAHINTDTIKQTSQNNCVHGLPNLKNS